MIKSSLAFSILTSLFSNSAECYKYANWENAAFMDRYVLHFMGFFASKVSTFQKFQDVCKGNGGRVISKILHLDTQEQ